MSLNLLIKASANHLMIAMLSLTFILSACDKKTPHRNKPARKVGQGGDPNQKAQAGAKPGTPGSPDKASQNDPTKTPAKPGDETTPADDIDAATDSKDKDSSTSPNVLARNGSTNSLRTRSGTIIPNDSTRPSNEGKATDATTPTTKGITPTKPQNSNDPSATTNDTTLADLQNIFGQLHNIYMNAWYTITKDKSSRPHNFFEDIATKMQNLGPILTIPEGESTPTSIRTRCEKYRLVQTIDKSQEKRRLLLYDCQTEQFANLLAFRSSGNQWQFATSQPALELLLPNQLGYLSTIPIKPICNVTINKEAGSARVIKAVCKDWGQELSATRAKDRKTIIFNSINYDIHAANVLETQAQFVDYDGSNQVCRTGLMKRSAPSSTELIYVDDEGDGQCHASPIDQGLPAVTAPPVAPSQSALQTVNPRVQVVQPPAKAKPVETTDPDTGEAINQEAIDNGNGDTDINPETEAQDPDSSTDKLPEDPTGDYSAITPSTTPPTQSMSTKTLDDGSQQLDFSSTVQSSDSAPAATTRSEHP